jgi:hypothetical protein
MTPTLCPTIELEMGNLPTQRGQTPDFSSPPPQDPSGALTRSSSAEPTRSGSFLVGMCGHHMLRAALAGVPITPPCHNPLVSGRPPVEQFPRQIPAPGGRPDPTPPEDS